MSETPAERIQATRLIAGEPCLDFANTAGSRTVGGEELLSSYEELVLWSLHAGIISEEEALRLRQIADHDRRQAERESQRAIALRESIFRVFSSVATMRTPPKAAMRTINDVAAEMLQHLRVAPAGDGFAWQWHGAREAVSFPLLAITRSATRLLVSEDVHHVRECQGRGCHRLFIDWTCNQSRRWCDMAACGNREKVRKFRARRRMPGPGGA